MGLVLDAVRHYCLGGCSALVVCARRSWPVPRGWGQCRALCLPRISSPPCGSRAVRGGSSRPVVAYPRSLVRQSMRSVRSAGSVRLPFWHSPRVLCVVMCSRSRGVPVPPPPWVGVARAPRAVLVVGARRALPRGLCPSACPASVPCSVWLFICGGGAARPHFPPARLAVVCLPWGRTARPGRGGEGRGGGGRPVRLASVRPSAFPGQATKRVSSALLSPCRGWPPYCSGSCSRVAPGRGPCGVVVRRLGLACLLRSPWEQAVRAWRRVAFGPCCVLSSGAAVLLGEGGTPPCLGGDGGPAPLRPAGPEGGSGGRGEGGSRRGSPSPSSGGAPRGPRPGPPFFAGSAAPCMLVRPRRVAAPGTRRGLPSADQPGRGGRGGGLCAALPGGVAGGPSGAGGCLTPVRPQRKTELLDSVVRYDLL